MIINKHRNHNIINEDLKIVKLDLVGYWDWDLKINECIICKTDLQDPFAGT